MVGLPGYIHTQVVSRIWQPFKNITGSQLVEPTWHPTNPQAITDWSETSLTWQFPCRQTNMAGRKMDHFFESNVFPIWTTPWKFNIAPKNIPSQKESSLPTIIFQGRAVKLWEGMGIFQPAMLVYYRVLGLGNPTCKTHVTPVASLTMLEIASLLGRGW